MKIYRRPGYLTSLFEGVMVTFLWSTSYILIKTGLNELPPLTFAAYRYMISSTILLGISRLRNGGFKRHVRQSLHELFFLGLFGFTIAQGLQYVGLSYLPAVTVTCILNFTPVIVLVFGVFYLQESPTVFQLVGLALALLGVYFFFAAPISGSEIIGIIVTLTSGIGWGAYMVSSRGLLQRAGLGPLNVTATSMFFGAIILMISALLIDGPIGISFYESVIILWLSLVNTALAFVLWNHALKKIKAFELAILQNTMLIQIGVLAWVFLGEALTVLKIIGMTIVFVGVFVVQIMKSNRSMT